MNKRNRKRLLLVFSAGVFAVPSFLAVANVRILNGAKGKSYFDLTQIPHHRVGIVLGCSPTTGNVKNPFFVGRIEAASRLYIAGKVDRLLVSGDHGRVDYDEPTAMAEALIEKGVLASHIVCDFAGFRTLDTMVRANKVFGLKDAAVITDDFHMARSLYFAEGAGIQADGFPSRALDYGMKQSTELREVFARAQAVLDQNILHSAPKYLGPPESIP